MKKTFFAWSGLVAAVAVVFICAGCNDGGVQKVNGEAEAFLGRFSGTNGGGDNSGTFKDARDGQTYKWVKIGNQKWMAQNLNYPTGESWCYENNPSYCNTYGRLYDWNTAVNACPTGWHLPSSQDLTPLEATVGGSEAAGLFLKAENGWNDNRNDNCYGKNYHGNGVDNYGFSALPGGFAIPPFLDEDGVSYARVFADVGCYGNWWTASKYGSSNAYDWWMGFDFDNVGVSYGPRDCGFSVRCLAD